MATQGTGNAQKERAKAFKKGIKEDKAFRERLNIFDTVLEEKQSEIAVLNKTIKNCQNDLDTHFKGNNAIMNKMELAKQHIQQLNKEIELIAE